MEYETALAPIVKINLSPKGLVKPLCDSCCTKDCTNPIQKTNISIFGVTREYKMYISGSGAMAVIGCRGYMNQEVKK